MIEYSDRKHRIVTDIAQIIRDNGVEMIMINQEYIEDKQD